jgi:hypothetical protein
MKIIALAAASVAASVLASPAGAVSGNQPVHAWVTDGTVYAVAATPHEVVIGGSFTLIGRATGSWVAVDPSGSVVPGAPLTNYPVVHAVSDGSNGWFLVTQGEDESNTVYHLLADKTWDKKWPVAANGSIDAVARHGGTLFVAGSFTKLGGERHARIAAVDVKTAKPLAWDPEVSALKAKNDASVDTLELSPDGGTLYFSGDFALVRGNRRSSMAAVSTTTAKVTAWAPTTDGSVYDLTAAGNVVYVAGDFGKIDGRGRAELGTVTAGNGALTDWNPVSNGAVEAVTLGPGGAPVYVGGTFTSVGGKSRRGMAALDPKSANATTWDANVNGEVDAILPIGGTVYFGGNFNGVGSALRSNLAAADARTGAPAAWDPRSDRTVRVLAAGPSGGRVFAGGDFATVGAMPRGGLAGLSLDGSSVLPWNPPVSGTIRALSYDPASSSVLFGGRYRLTGDAVQHSLGMLSAADVPQVWGGDFNAFVSSIARSPDGTTYVGGSFSTVQGKTRKRLAALDPSGALTSWNSGANALVTQLLLDGDQLFVGGNFTSVGGASRRSLTVLDTATGLATGWDAGLDGNVNALALRGDTLYVAGDFENVGDRARNYLASVFAETGAPTSWDPDPDGTVDALALDPAGTVLYAGGEFTMVGRAERNAAVFDTAAGFLLGWRPVAPFTAYAAATSLDGSTVYLGGDNSFDIYK